MVNREAPGKARLTIESGTIEFQYAPYMTIQSLLLKQVTSQDKWTKCFKPKHINFIKYRLCNHLSNQQKPIKSSANSRIN
eukprot:5688909-Amphidinium_carterae.1